MFRGSASDGRSIEKRYRFLGNSYLFDVAASGGRKGQRLARPHSSIRTLPVVARLRIRAGSGLRECQADREDPGSCAPFEVLGAGWAGFSAQYFAALGMPQSGTATAWLAKAVGTAIARLDLPATEGSARFQVFMGPKERDVLAA